MPLYTVQEKATRAFLVFMGLIFLGLGKIYWDLRTTEPFAPEFWPWWFVITGVVCLVYAAFFHSKPWMMASGTLSVVGFGSRVGALVITATRGGAINIPAERWLAGSLTWSALTAATALIWLVLIRPVSEYRRTYR